MSGELIADFSIRPAQSSRPEDFTARGEIRNVGGQGLRLNIAPLSSPSLALEIVDAGGERVPLPPPPVPGAMPETRLAPGESYVFEFSGFVPQWTGKGSYRARLRYLFQPRNPDADQWSGRLFSEWATFEIA